MRALDDHCAVPRVTECLQHPLQPPHLRVRRLAGAMAQPDDVAPELSPNGSDLDTARPSTNGLRG